MKPQPGTLHLIDGEVRLATEPKPDKKYHQYHGQIDGSFHLDIISYKKALKSWEQSTKKVVNAEPMDDSTFWIELTDKKDRPYLAPETKEGQNCLYIPEGSDARIVELK